MISKTLNIKIDKVNLSGNKLISIISVAKCLNWLDRSNLRSLITKHLIFRDIRSIVNESCAKLRSNKTKLI